MPDVVTITNAAATRATALLIKAGKPTGGLRVRVHSAGCEGFVAILDLAEAPDAAEIEIADNGVRLFADIGSMLKLPGATLDYLPTDHGAEFAWTHPAATGVCGCAEPGHDHSGDNDAVTSAST